MKLPGNVKVELYVAPIPDIRSSEDSVQGMIFLLDRKEPTDMELLAQKKFTCVAEPEPPPHKKVTFNYILQARSDVELCVYQEYGTRPK